MSVAHQSTEDTQPGFPVTLVTLVHPPDKFLYVFKAGPEGPKARRHHRGSGRLPATQLRFALGAALGLARTCQHGAGSKTADLAINDRHPLSVGACTKRPATGPCGWSRLPSGRGLPDRPASNHGEVRSGPARVKGACGVASRSSKLAPGHPPVRT